MKEAFDLIRKKLEREKYTETELNYYNGDMKMRNRMINVGINTALSIVSEVEAEFEKDVCEWRWGVDRAMVQCKGDYIIFESRRLFSFCPYCGKKIKVVE